MAKQLVRIVKKHRPYNVGEIAGFPEGDTLKDMLRRGVVELLTPDEVRAIKDRDAKRVAAQKEIDAVEAEAQEAATSKPASAKK